MAKMTKEEAVQWYAQNRGLYKKLSYKIANILTELLDEANLTIHAITDRSKEVDSFKRKIDNPKYIDPLKQITDFSGIRIIAYVEDDLKPICQIIEANFDIDKQNSSDKSTELGIDKVGYKSIHYVAKIKSDRLNLTEYKKFKDLKFEIQVRTILQHAWAEIEHDRNYKFNGVLPKEIERRFKILSGTLELVDREFNQLSKDIDNISKGVIIAEEKNELDEIPINSTTIKQLLNSRFDQLIKNGILEPNFNNFDNVILKELASFGIKTLAGLDKIIPHNYHEKLKDIPSSDPYNFLSITRDFMMIENINLYFTKAWKESWGGLSKATKQMLESYNVNIQNIIKKHKLIVD